MTTTDHLHAFIADLPKAELHVHHVGSASPRIVSALAARHPDSKVPTDPEALVDYFTQPEDRLCPLLVIPDHVDIQQ